MKNSGIYCGSTTHARRLPSRNRFKYPIYMAYVELEELCAGKLDNWPIFSSKSPYAITSLLSKDHMIHEDQNANLDTRVRNFVQRNNDNKRPTGKIFLVTNLRILGVEFNPVSFYYIYQSENPNIIECIVAEVANFPWFEQHAYFTKPIMDNNSSSSLIEYSPVKKEFHVSPFMPVSNLQYLWSFSNPNVENHIKVRITSKDIKLNKPMFYASMDAKLIPWNNWNLFKLQTMYPLHSLMVMVGILYEAAKLFMKGFTFFPHPTGASSTLSKIVEYIVAVFVCVSQFFKSLWSSEKVS